MDKKSLNIQQASDILNDIENKNSEEKKHKILTSTQDKLDKEKTMKLSIQEGCACSVMSGMGTDYIGPFAIALNASNSQIGLLSSIPGLISPISQIFGSKLMEKYPRKKIVYLGVVLQALMWIPILSLALMLWKNTLVNYLPLLLVLFYTLFSVSGAIGGPAWFSMLGDIVPEKIRGKYFGKRNRLCGLVALLSTIIAAFVLDIFKTKGFVLFGFTLLFSIACIFRLISSQLFKKHYDPSLKLSNDYYFTFWQFIKKAPFNNYGRFTFFVALFYIGVMISSPFFGAYMLRDLNFSYTTYMLVNISATIFSLLAMPIVGKISDKYGNRIVYKVGALFVGITPILWAVSPSPIYLICIVQLFSGVGWACFNLSTSNFIYDSVTVQRRGICVAYFNVVVGIGVFIGATLGGIMADKLPVSFMNNLLFIFIISGFARLIAVLIMMPLIREVREIRTKQNPLLYLAEIVSPRIMIYGIFNEIFAIEKKIERLYHKKLKS